MHKIVLFDEGDFSFYEETQKPLGGTQTAFIGLVKGFEKLGFLVEVRNNCEVEYLSNLISWKKLDYSEKIIGSIYIVNRNPKLLELVPKSAKKFLWLHNRGNYLIKLKNIKYLLMYYPILVFSGKFHKSTFYLWPFFKTKIIPYGLTEKFFQNKEKLKTPGPKAIFTSNPLRSLRWLVDRWIEVRKVVPNAELHIFSGPAPYGSWGNSISSKMNVEINHALSKSQNGIVVHDPIPKDELIKELKSSRVMVYRGDIAETFCLSIAEALELGIPCVTMDLGSMKERIENEKTGFISNGDKEFVDKIVQVLTDNQLWTSFHENLYSKNVNLSWSESAKKFIQVN
ncbi:MAG: glycosyltransferase [Algoriphagus sp.]|nr:glycosyltransferase [Algoriphagus sp.]